MGSKKTIGMMGLVLAGASLGMATDAAYGVAFYDVGGSIEIFVDSIAVGSASPDGVMPDGLSIIGGAELAVDMAIAVGDSEADTDFITDPGAGPFDLGVGDGIFHSSAAFGSAGAPPDSFAFSTNITNGTISVLNESDTETFTIFFAGGGGFDIDLENFDPGSDSEGRILLHIEGVSAGVILSVDDEANTLADGDDVSFGAGGPIFFSVTVGPGEFELITSTVEASGSARAREERGDRVIPEPVTAILGGLGLAALAAGTNRRRA